MRSLLALLIIILTLGASGISSAIASTTSETEDCCGAGANARDDTPTEERDDCPPLCHACACSPTFAIPNAGIAGAFVAIRDRDAHKKLSSQLPVGPPGQGVFHPPRVWI